MIERIAIFVKTGHIRLFYEDSDVAIYDIRDSTTLRKFTSLSHYVNRYYDEDVFIIVFKETNEFYILDSIVGMIRELNTETRKYVCGSDIKPFAKYFNETLWCKYLYNSPFDLIGIPKPTEGMILSAVRGDYEAINFVKNPSIEAQKLALAQSYESIKFIHQPIEEVISLAIEMLKAYGRKIEYHK